MKLIALTIICLISLCASMQIDISLFYLRSLLKLDQNSFNDIINKELPKGYKAKFALSNFTISQKSPNQFEISIPCSISVFSKYRGHTQFEWQPKIFRNEISDEEPHYYKYSVKGHSKVSFPGKDGCIEQMAEGCERLERLLENFVSVMFGKWDYPLWEPVSGIGKITKYNLWYLLLMSGEINITKEQIIFKASNSDIGFVDNQLVNYLPDFSKNSAFRLFLDKDMIDASLKQKSRKVYRLHQKQLSNFTNVQSILNNHLTFKLIQMLYPELDFKEKSPIDIFINPYLPLKSDREELDEGLNQFSILTTDYHSRPIISMVNTFSFRILAKYLSTQKWLSFSHGYLTLSANFTIGTTDDNDIVLTLLDLQILGTPKVYDETNKNILIDSKRFLDRFNSFKYQLLAQDFKLNLRDLFNLECFGIDALKIDVKQDGINFEADPNDTGAQRCPEIEDTVKRELSLWVTEFQLQMKYYLQEISRKQRVLNMNGEVGKYNTEETEEL